MVDSIIKCNLFDSNKFNVPNELHENKFITGHKMMLPSYNNKKFVFETDPIRLTQYGIPSLNNTYIKHDEDRMYVKIPYDKSQPSCVDLFNMLEEIDKLMENSKDHMFGALSHKYKYVPLVRNMLGLATNDKEQNDYSKKFHYCKVKFCKDFESSPGDVTTQVFKKDNDGQSYPVDIKNVTDIAAHLVWQSTAKFVITMNKIWINNPNSNDYQDYGILLKCLTIEIISEQPISKNLSENIIKCTSFVDNKFRIPSKKEFINNSMTPSQITGFPSYDQNGIYKNFIFETGPIKFVQYGIPNLNGSYINSDKDRMHMRLPYDANQQSCFDLFNMLEKIDKLVENNKDQMFGTQSHKYKYMPLVRKIEFDDDDDEDTQNKKKPAYLPYCKVKFGTDADTGDITTQVFKRGVNGKIYFLNDIKTVTDLASHLMWGCTARFIIKVNRIWISKNQNPLYYGISLKCDQIEIVSDSPIYKGLAHDEFIEKYYSFDPPKYKGLTNEKYIEKNYYPASDNSKSYLEKTYII